MTPPPGAWQRVKARDRLLHDAEPEPARAPDPEPNGEPEIREPEIVGPDSTEPVVVADTAPPHDNHDVPPALPVCTFCGRTIESVQYAWPDWLCEFLTEHQHDWNVHRTEPGSDLTLFEQVGQEIDEYSTSVCGTCNSGWIQRLEVNVSPFLRPMILGEPTPLPSARRKLLARWAAKTAVVMEGTFPEAVRTPRPVADYLRLTGVPGGTQVLVGRYEGDAQLLNRARVLFRKTTGVDQYRSFTTLIIGKLAVQVLADPWIDRVPDVPEKVQRRFIPLASTNAGKTDWPPELSIGDAFFDNVRQGPQPDAPSAPAAPPDPATSS